MTDEMLGLIVRDGQTGRIGRVIGAIEWLDRPDSLIIEPTKEEEGAQPLGIFITRSTATVIPQPYEQAEGERLH